ncbi:MAG: hypothetical protein ACUVXA_13665 [Candidatus Jordarchaeum sp.]|uniref:hypothetical protein n=1 Tax=Candidatus Jordarchaeum sp. TaxID=2823881 RepID=UPI00404A77AD
MSEFKDFLTGLVFGTILRSADNMGVKPTLLGRQSAAVLGPIINDLAQKFIGKEAPKTREELLTDIETMGKVSGVLGKEFEITHTQNTINIKVVECPWVEMGKYGKTIGYKACPLCGIIVLLMGALEAQNISRVVNISAVNNDTVCELGLEEEQK